MIGAYLIMGHDAENSGVTSGIRGSQYGIRIRTNCAHFGVINGMTIGNWHDIATFALENATSRADLVIINVGAVQTGGAGVHWILPTTAHTARFLGSNAYPIWRSPNFQRCQSARR